MRKLVIGFYDLLSSTAVICVFLLHSIRASRPMRCVGLPYIRNEGSIAIGPGAQLNSSRRGNPTGISDVLVIICGRGGNLQIGRDFKCSNSIIYASQNIRIGDRVMIGTDCKIYDTDFHSLYAAERSAFQEYGARSDSISIEDDVFIGTGCVILKGVRIGAGAVVGANSVVCGDIPPGEIWAGNPARRIGKVEG